jgi:hypothetical protein
MQADELKARTMLAVYKQAIENGHNPRKISIDLVAQHPGGHQLSDTGGVCVAFFGDYILCFGSQAVYKKIG